MMRIVDIFLSIPFLFIVLIVAVRYGASVLGLSLIIGGFTWLVPARLVRGEVLTLRTRDFVSAARTAGAGRWRLINRHLHPERPRRHRRQHHLPGRRRHPAVAALGFLGFGLNYPSRTGATCSPTAPRTCRTATGGWSTRSGICIVLVVMACNLIGDALRDSLDVRLRAPVAAPDPAQPLS